MRLIFCSKFKNKLRTIQPQQQNKVSNFQLKVVNKTAASDAQLAKRIFLLHAYSRTTTSFQLSENKQKLHTAF